ncbi:MAG TPA: hypothetical protein VG778_02240, partial [Blastocatellia bacterium]|nr:hypothetical protein [Blastocatellia bacterium]
RRPDEGTEKRPADRSTDLRSWINGNRLQGNHYSLNGIANNDIDGQPAISINNLDSLDALHVVTTRGSGDVTANGAASVRLMSRSGTNDFHGTVFEFYRNRRFGASSPLERRSGLEESLSFKSHLFGGTFGGPILRDRLFFFGSFQGEEEDSSRFATSTASFLTPTQLGLAQLAAEFGSSPAVIDLIARGPLSRTFGSPSIGLTRTSFVFGPPVEFGEIRRVIPSTAEGYEAGGRIDFVATSRDTLKGSYWYNTRNAEEAVGRLAAGYFGSVNNQAQLAGFQWHRNLSPRLTNELGISFNRSRLALNSVAPEGPGVDVGIRGLAYGASPLLPSNHRSTLFSVSELLTHVAGRHTLKIGGQLSRRFTSFSYLPGEAGNFSYETFEDFVRDRPAAIVVSIGDRNFRFEQTQQHYFIDDAWRARRNLTITLGLGYQNEGQPINGLADRIRDRETNPATALFDASVPIDLRTINKVDRDNNNFTPRLGVAYTPGFRIGGWNLFGNDQTVIRAGASLSYDQTAYRPLADVAASTPNVMLGVLTPASGVMPAFPNIPGATELRARFSSDPASFGRTEFSRDFRTTFSPSWHLAIDREIGGRSNIEISYVGLRGIGLVRALDASSAVDGPTRLYESTGRSIYHSLQARADFRVSDTLSVGTSYTLAKLIDDVPGSSAQIAGGIGSATTQTVPFLQQFAQNPADVSRGERALSDLDRRHSFVGHFIWTLPIKRAQNGFVERLLGGWQASGIVELASGSPFTPLQHISADSQAIFASVFSSRLGAVRPFLGNPLAREDAVAFSNAANRAFGFFLNPDGSPFISSTGFIVADRSGFAAGALRDARFVYNDYAVERRAVAMGFAPDHFGPTYAAGRPFGDVGRNSLIGPGLQNIDFALLKTTKLSEKVSLQFRAEAFNLFNHPNRTRPGFIVENAGGFGFLDAGETDASPRRVRFALKLLF